MSEFNPDQPYGKGALIITQDNIDHAVRELAARRRIQSGTGSPEDYDIVNGRQAMIEKIRGGTR
ncbi:MAG: hypothetical protein ACRDHG_04605 [Anaerolineales bacterium]